MDEMKAEEVGKKARESASLEMLWEKEPGRVEETESMQRVTLSKGGGRLQQRNGCLSQHRSWE